MGVEERFLTPYVSARLAELRVAKLVPVRIFDVHFPVPPALVDRLETYFYTAFAELPVHGVHVIAIHNGPAPGLSIT